MRSRPTVADVARTAGVSRTTVSHALSGKGRVDARTRERVQAVADRLGYVPSRTARNLALGRSDTIGLLLPRLARLPMDELLRTDWYGRVALAASQEAVRHQRALTILPPVEDAAELMSFGLDGVIVLDLLPEDPRAAILQEATSSVVLLGRDPQGLLGPSVVPDTDQGMHALLDHLWEQGMHSLGLIAPDIPWAEGQQAIQAASGWCQTRGVTPIVARAEVAQCVTRDDVAAVGRATASDVLASGNRPDALIGLLEDFGRGIASAARTRGLTVPGDLLVAQDVDGVMAQVADPPITAIDLNITGQMAAAVDLLVAESPARADATMVQTVPVSLVIRESTTAVLPPRG